MNVQIISVTEEFIADIILYIGGVILFWVIDDEYINYIFNISSMTSCLYLLIINTGIHKKKLFSHQLILEWIS